MTPRFYNIKDFRNEIIEEGRQIFESRAALESAEGTQSQYAVFLSHSLKDANLVKQIRQRLERDHNISVYIDWEEDNGTSRDQIAAKVKAAMEISNSFLVIKTDNSDNSSWVAWETGYFDRKSSERIGVLLIEDEAIGFTHETFKHQEYLQNYELLGVSDIVPFVKSGMVGVHESRASTADSAFRENRVGLTSGGSLGVHDRGENSSTKFFGSGENS